jgi:uncharacterized protein (TIGR03437 family)
MYRTWILLLTLFPSVIAQTVSFGPPNTYPALKGPLAAATGDFNGDGKADLAVVDSSAAQVSIYLGNGDGTFKTVAPASLPGDCGAAYLAVGGFATEGKADLLAVCALGEIVVLPNTGGGTFGKAVSTTLAAGAWAGNLVLGELSPAIADFNGDGHPDLAIATFNLQGLVAGWYFLAGKGNGAFAAPATLNLGAGGIPISMAAGDFNGDSKPDLVVTLLNTATFGPQILFGPGNGEGTFGTFVPMNVPVSIGSILLPADLNGDGKLDLVVTGSSTVEALIQSTVSGNSAVSVYLGDGKGGFTVAYNTTLNVFMGGAVLGDFRGTGKLDLAVGTVDGNFLSGTAPTGGLLLYPGVGDGTFGAPVTIPSRSTTIPTGIVTADFNGDGHPDLGLSTIPAANIGSVGPVGASSNFGALIANALAALPVGNAEVLLNMAGTPTFTDANGASFANGAQAVDSIVSAFGTGLAAGKEGASALPLPTTLGGVTIEVKDAAGVTMQAPLFYVSPEQINYAIPDGTAVGTATVTIQSGTGTFVAQQQIVSVAPGIFGANGFAVGAAVKAVSGAQQSTALYANGAEQAIDVSGGETFLVLYGTGIRNHTNAVTATVGTAGSLPVAYAGAQGTFFGEDQINIQLPASLKGAGTVSVTVTVDGQVSNAVKIQVN